jgi:hypothetical protein
MSSLDNASSFLQRRVSPQIAAEGDWPHLRLISGALFGNALERFECDLLYALPIRDPHTSGKTEMLIYILFEHQSRREPMMPLRLLEYMLGIWRRWLEDHSAGEGLPAILPLVLSQVEGGWNLSPEFADLFNCPASLRPVLAKHLPHFEHLTFDLAATREDDIPGNERVRAALALMKAVLESRVREWLEWAPPLLRALDPESLRMLFLYAVNAETRLDLPEFLEKVRKQNIPNAETAIMSIADSIAEKVRIEATAQGKAEGRREGQAEGLHRGALIGQIQALERVLRRAGSSEATLNELGADQLNEKIAALERELHLG